MGQDRWVSYIFRYRDNLKCESGGFIKVQKIAQKKEYLARIQIGLRLYKKKACKCLAYLVYDGNNAKYMTDIYFKPEEKDTIVKRIELPFDNPLGDGMSFDEYDGIFFVCDDGEILLGMWKEKNINVGQIRLSNTKIGIKKVEEEKRENTPTKEREIRKEDSKRDNIKEEMESAYTEEESRDYMQACYEMMETYPKLPLFPDSQLVECIRIVPHDLGKLAIGNWRLGVNSFLTHGYYHYRYLMMGRVKFDLEEKYVIGVPGVYTNKEKYLANMFGFNVFVPVKRTKTLTGNFGYWIWEVSRV